MDPTPVRVKLESIHCFDEGDGPGSAEPYLWTVFFKIDGDTTRVVGGVLQGSATVIETPGERNNLGASSVNGGDDVSIPDALGLFETMLVPIPVFDNATSTTPSSNISGVIGCAIILLEQDSTPAQAIADGHAALTAAMQTQLDELIGTLNAFHPSPTDEQIAAMVTAVGDAVNDAISNGVGVWDWLTAFGNMDDKIGTKAVYVSQSDICKALLRGIPIYEDWPNEGHWDISGSIHINQVIDNIAITCVDKPSGNVEAHHIETVGGTFNGQNWRMKTAEVMDRIASGTTFVVNGADGSQSRVEVRKHFTSAANPTGRYLATVADDSKEDNLLSLQPSCLQIDAS
jgi:hypothetical protein